MGLGRHIVVVLFLCGQAEHPGERGLGSVTVRDRTAKSCDHPFRESTTSGVLHTRRHIGRCRNRRCERRSHQCVRRSGQGRARFFARRHTQVPQPDLQGSGGHSELPGDPGNGRGLRLRPVDRADVLHGHEQIGGEGVRHVLRRLAVLWRGAPDQQVPELVGEGEVASEPVPCRCQHDDLVATERQRVPVPPQRDDDDLNAEGVLSLLVEARDEALPHGGASPRRRPLDMLVRHAGCACR